MSKHTKGPWHVFKDSSIYSKHADYTLAEIVAGMTDGECDANARLIAAAPELLEALRELHTIVNRAIHDGDWIVDGACDPDACMMRAEDLIAKATGEQK
jgi:hypothetical protein